MRTLGRLLSLSCFPVLFVLAFAIRSWYARHGGGPDYGVDMMMIFFSLPIFAISAAIWRVQLREWSASQLVMFSFVTAIVASVANLLSLYIVIKTGLVPLLELAPFACAVTAVFAGRSAVLRWRERVNFHWARE